MVTTSHFKIARKLLLFKCWIVVNVTGAMHRFFLFSSICQFLPVAENTHRRFILRNIPLNLYAKRGTRNGLLYVSATLNIRNRAPFVAFLFYFNVQHNAKHIHASMQCIYFHFFFFFGNSIIIMRYTKSLYQTEDLNVNPDENKKKDFVSCTQTNWPNNSFAKSGNSAHFIAI